MFTKLDQMDRSVEYSISLYIIEGIGFNENNEEVTLHASLNGSKFQVQRRQSEVRTIFNNHCTWECSYDDLKRMRTDNRPIKIECFYKVQANNAQQTKPIGYILLPLRTVQIVRTLKNLEIKLHCHKVCGLAGKWRKIKPEIYLSAIITTKELMKNVKLEDYFPTKPIDIPKYVLPSTRSLSSQKFSMLSSKTSSMLRSQQGIYVEHLEDQCLFQVGNHPTDCDTFVFTLILRQVKHLPILAENAAFRIHYELFGCPWDIDLLPNSDGVYEILEKLVVKFKSSLDSLKEYCKRVFYILIGLYCNDIIIGEYKFTFEDLLPPSLEAMSVDNEWEVQDSFNLQTLYGIPETSSNPVVEYVFSLTHISTKQSPPTNSFPIDKKACGDMADDDKDFELPLTIDFAAEKEDKLEDRCESQEDESKASQRKEKVVKFCPSPDALPVNTPFNIDKNSFADMADGDAILVPPSARHISTAREDAPDVQCPAYKTNLTTEKIIRFCPSSPQSTPKQPNDRMDINNDIAYKVIAELENWKCQQIDNFLTELKRKEALHLRQLSADWQRQKNEITQKLQEKLDQCRQLTESLEEAQTAVRLKAIQQLEDEKAFEKTKHELDKRYTVRSMEIEEKDRRRNDEMKYALKLNDLRLKELQMENNREAEENEKLRSKVAKLEAEMDEFRMNYIPKENLTELLDDVRKQCKRYAEMEKSKKYYKEQWINVVKEMHTLKIQLLKAQEEKIRQSNCLGFLKSIYKIEMRNITNSEIAMPTSQAMMLILM